MQETSHFLCDNSGYILGVSNKGKAERDILCFGECRNLHEKLLSGINSPAVKALMIFFHNWDPGKAKENVFVI